MANESFRYIKGAEIKYPPVNKSGRAFVLYHCQFFQVGDGLSRVVSFEYIASATSTSAPATNCFAFCWLRHRPL
jgi:hypothetical protein